MLISASVTSHSSGQTAQAPAPSIQLAAFLADARKLGLVVEPTTGGYRVHKRDARAAAKGRYGLGVDIVTTERGGFHSATRLDVDLSLTKTIRTLKEVRQLLA